jgi:hypothetical protein
LLIRLGLTAEAATSALRNFLAVESEK